MMPSIVRGKHPTATAAGAAAAAPAAAVMLLLLLRPAIASRLALYAP